LIFEACAVFFERWKSILEIVEFLEFVIDLTTFLDEPIDLRLDLISIDGPHDNLPKIAVGDDRLSRIV